MVLFQAHFPLFLDLGWGKVSRSDAWKGKVVYYMTVTNGIRDKGLHSRYTLPGHFK